MRCNAVQTSAIKLHYPLPPQALSVFYMRLDRKVTILGLAAGTDGAMQCSNLCGEMQCSNESLGDVWCWRGREASPGPEPGLPLAPNPMWSTSYG